MVARRVSESTIAPTERAFEENESGHRPMSSRSDKYAPSLCADCLHNMQAIRLSFDQFDDTIFLLQINNTTFSFVSWYSQFACLNSERRCISHEKNNTAHERNATPHKNYKIQILSQKQLHVIHKIYPFNDSLIVAVTPI